MATKSPFLIIKNFISPLECENILTSMDISVPNSDDNDHPIKTVLRIPILQQRVWTALESYFDGIENYYGVEISELTPVDVEWYPEGCIEESQRCENSVYNGSKWHIINDYDFTIVVFLKDYNDKRDFDEDFECYGGKLNIVNHAFAFTPQRGTAIIFPSNQYFINKTESPAFGDAFQLRLNIVCEERFKYNPRDYEGNHGIWFRNL
jgi:hypothetical protein